MPNSLLKSATAHARKHLLILLLFVALSVGMTWPLVMHLDSHVIDTKWYYDALTMTMVLGTRVNYLLGTGAGGMYDNYFCFPVPDSIVFNENLFGLSLLYLPFYLVTKDYLLSYNLLLLLCLTMSGYFTYLLVRRLTGSDLAAILSGAGFAFCPYVFFEMGRVQLVATQWIALCAFFLHRAVETGRFRDMLGLGLAYVMQLGSCLYYGLFLLILFAFVGTYLVFVNRRWNLAFWGRLAAAAVICAPLAAVEVYPYLTAQNNFSLTRSLEKAEKYSGQLSHLLNVYPTNKTLALLHEPAKGASEPIAFTGFTILLLALTALVFPLIREYRRDPSKRTKNDLYRSFALWILVFFAAIGSAVVFGTFLAAIALVIVVYVFWRRANEKRVLSSTVTMYLIFLPFITLLYLGIEPLEVDRESVFGPYYYLYRLLPGFDSVRYVSRQFVLVMLTLVMLAGFGAAAIFRSISKPSFRITLFLVLLSLILVEFLNAPVSLARVPGRRTLPAAYRWLAKHKGDEPIAIIPGHYIGYYGALHNYYALFHQRKTINGKSSWIPPITRLYIHEMRRFPRQSGTRLLQTLGAKYVIVHTEELSPSQAQRTIEYLTSGTQSYKQVLRSGDDYSDSDYIFEVLPSTDPTLRLASMPSLPKYGIERLHRWHTSVSASRANDTAMFAFDSDVETRWSTGRTQKSGDFFEFELARTERVVAVEFTDFEYILDAPLSYELLVSRHGAESGQENWKSLVKVPDIRLYKEMVYEPRDFVFRIMLPEPTPVRRLRIKLLDTVPGHSWAINETSIWIKP